MHSEHSAPKAPVKPVTPVITGQKAQKVQANQCLGQSELPFHNSPVRPVQLEQNVHEPPGTMPSVQDEHTSEHSQAFQGHLNSDSPDYRADGSPDRSALCHSGRRSDHECSVHRSQSIRFDALDHRLILLNHTLQEHWSEFEHGAALNRTGHRSDVSRSSRNDSSIHHAAISLRHVDPGEHSPASLLRHRRVRSRSRLYDSVSSRHLSCSPSRSRGKKKSHKKRKYSSTSSSSCSCSSSSSSRERARNRHKSKKKKHTSSLSSKRDKRAKKHKRKRSPSPSPSVPSSSSSSQQRSLARNVTRTCSRSPLSADEIPHDPAPRIESPALSRDHLSLYADDDEFNSPAEDQQYLVPEAETQSNVSSEDIKFQNLIKEVFKFLPSNRFPKKTDVDVGNRPRSSIEMEMMKAPKKRISLPQSKCPLVKAIDCIKQCLGAVETDGSYPMPSTISQDWLPSKADIAKLVRLKYYQAHDEFIPTANASALDPDANRLDLSLSGSHPVKVTSLQALETQSRQVIRILSHAEIFSFAAFKCLQSESMDSRVVMKILQSMSMAITDAMSIATVQTLGLQQMFQSLHL